MSIQAAKPYLFSVIKHFNTIQQEMHRGGDVSYAFFAARVGTNCVGRYFKDIPMLQNLMSAASLFACATDYSPITNQPLVAECAVEHLSEKARSHVAQKFQKGYGESAKDKMVNVAIKSLVAIGAAYFAARLQLLRNPDLPFKPFLLHSAAVIVLTNLCHGVYSKEIKESSVAKFAKEFIGSIGIAEVVRIGAVYAATKYIVPHFFEGQSIAVNWKWEVAASILTVLVEQVPKDKK